MLTLILPILRHIIQAGAGALVAKGLLDESTATALVGGVLSIVTAAWMVYGNAIKPKSDLAPIPRK